MKQFILIGISYLSIAYLLSWTPFEKFDLRKYYRDPSSTAAIMMGGLDAGIVETFSSLKECLTMKEAVEKDDKDIGYTNSRFACIQR